MFAPRAILMCVHFDFIEVHYRVVGEKIRERKTNHVIPRNCASHYSNGPRARTAPLFARACAAAVMHNATRVRCTMRTMSNASALAHRDKLDDFVFPIRARISESCII